MSIALQHKRKCIAEREQKKSQAGIEQGGLHQKSIIHSAIQGIVAMSPSLEALTANFSADWHTMGLLTGDSERTPFKKELIEKYRPLCVHYMATRQDWGQLNPLFWWLIWRADIESFESIEPDFYQGALNGLTVPVGKFKSTWPTLYCDLVKNHYKALLDDEQTPPVDVISKVIADLSNGSMVTNQPLKAKLFALYGKTVLLTGDIDTAANAFEKALALDEGIGVKKLLKACTDNIAIRDALALQGENDAN